MTMRMWTWFRSLLVSRSVRGAWRRAENAKRDLRVRMSRLDRADRRFKSMIRRLESLSGEWMEQIEDAQRAAKNAQTTIESLEAKVQVLEEMTVPLLVDEHRAYIERERARTDLEVRRQVAYSVRDGEER